MLVLGEPDEPVARREIAGVTDRDDDPDAEVDRLSCVEEPPEPLAQCPHRAG